jgi:hypothetical protein
MVGCHYPLSYISIDFRHKSSTGTGNPTNRQLPNGRRRSRYGTSKKTPDAISYIWREACQNTSLQITLRLARSEHEQHILVRSAIATSPLFAHVPNWSRGYIRGVQGVVKLETGFKKLGGSVWNCLILGPRPTPGRPVSVPSQVIKLPTVNQCDVPPVSGLTTPWIPRL